MSSSAPTSTTETVPSPPAKEEAQEAEEQTSQQQVTEGDDDDGKVQPPPRKRRRVSRGRSISAGDRSILNHCKRIALRCAQLCVDLDEQMDNLSKTQKRELNRLRKARIKGSYCLARLNSIKKSVLAKLNPRRQVYTSIFWADTYPIVAKENPGMSNPDISREIARRWKLLSAQEKEKLKERL